MGLPFGSPIIFLGYLILGLLLTSSSGISRVILGSLYWKVSPLYCIWLLPRVTLLLLRLSAR